MKIINIKNKYRYAADHKILVEGTVANNIEHNVDGNKCRFLLIEDGTNNLIRCVASLKIRNHDIVKAGDDIRALIKIKKRNYIKKEKMDIIDAVVVEII